MFRRAVSNLVSNALDHAAPGSTIVLKATAQPRAMSISVTNSGKVIPPIHLDNIFDRFYRVDPARHESGKNSGLGLAIVKSIMELHRGSVEVESGDGRTTFTLTFPKSAAIASLEESTV
jgi:two-component system heavy metal sensor histidine kinase CusS